MWTSCASLGFLFLVPPLASPLPPSGARDTVEAPAPEPRNEPVPSVNVSVDVKEAAPTPTRREPLRGLIYAEATVGYETLALQSLRATALIPKSVGLRESGPALGFAAGARLLLATLGFRYRSAQFSSAKLLSVDAEMGLHFPIGRVEPHLLMGAGYAALVLEKGADDLEPALDITGFDFEVGIGVDYHVTQALSFGAKVHGDALVMPRAGLTNMGSLESEAAACLRMPTTAKAKQCALDKARATDGSSLGAAGTFAVGLGVRF